MPSTKSNVLGSITTYKRKAVSKSPIVPPKEPEVQEVKENIINLSQLLKKNSKKRPSTKEKSGSESKKKKIEHKDKKLEVWEEKMNAYFNEVDNFDLFGDPLLSGNNLKSKQSVKKETVDSGENVNQFDPMTELSQPSSQKLPAPILPPQEKEARDLQEVEKELEEAQQLRYQTKPDLNLPMSPPPGYFQPMARILFSPGAGTADAGVTSAQDFGDIQEVDESYEESEAEGPDTAASLSTRIRRQFPELAREYQKYTQGLVECT